MIDEKSAESVKKVVGKKKPDDVWNELYRLNTFAANLGLFRSANDGYPPKKVVGKPSAIAALRKPTAGGPRRLPG
jgi:hypothetical protein